MLSSYSGFFRCNPHGRKQACMLFPCWISNIPPCFVRVRVVTNFCNRLWYRQWALDQSPKSHNAPDPYRTIQNRNVHISCIVDRCIVGLVRLLYWSSHYCARASATTASMTKPRQCWLTQHFPQNRHAIPTLFQVSAWIEKRIYATSWQKLLSCRMSASIVLSAYMNMI